ncbi:type III-B CRISPR module RAMP protein Cmr4 [Clostridium sp. MCC353]|uniref:type III-B CRISPR module RAMP protein Cmr4 n=1 Tax=Clostridium sp. MCC353 TaxID=2592646 RepID=UPI001C02347A|nr:type III-B CRISPR module RAMP protein Cmr4 [Clostridium sp. MCC353]MBT9778140.1 type III-B CRISPR module RAMP protein Cmr4 [Clostridium sp. MCC353]
MYNDSAMIMMFNTITSTHPGSGTELSYVDMPIQREGHTGYPKIESSTLKGCIRNHVSLQECGSDKSALIDRIFGKMGSGDFASAVSITDARILFFPVKSAKGIMAWITCPMVLNRFFKDYQLAYGEKFPDLWEVKEGSICENGCKINQQVGGKDVIMLEDYTFTVKKDVQFENFLQEMIKQLPENAITKDMILERAVILSDDDFSGFVKYSTEVNTRIRMDIKTGTVAENGLFTEEYLPPESILYSLAFFTDTHQAQGEEKNTVELDKNQVKKEFLKLFPGGTIQVGADSTLGKGLIEVKMWGES